MGLYGRRGKGAPAKIGKFPARQLCFLVVLLLKRHLVALVRAGKKSQTIRLWSRPIVCAGQISYTPGLGRLRILRVEELADFHALTDADAIADGFSNRAELLAELERHYPVIPAGKRLFRVVFQWPIEPGAASRTHPATGAPAPERPSVAEDENAAQSKEIQRDPPPANISRALPRRAGIDLEPAAAHPPRRAAHIAASPSRLMKPDQREILRQYVLTHRPLEPVRAVNRE